MSDNIKNLEKNLAKRGLKLKLKKCGEAEPLDLTYDDYMYGFFNPKAKSVWLSEEENKKYWENLLKGQKDD